MRIVLAALSFILLAQAPAYALDARDLVGRWATEWSSGPGLPGNQTNVWITPDADVNSLDGVWEAPGTNGLLFGTLSRRDDDGALVWSGRWTAPPEMAEEANGETDGRRIRIRVHEPPYVHRHMVERWRRGERCAVERPSLDARTPRPMKSAALLCTRNLSWRVLPAQRPALAAPAAGSADRCPAD